MRWKEKHRIWNPMPSGSTPSLNVHKSLDSGQANFWTCVLCVIQEASIHALVGWVPQPCLCPHHCTCQLAMSRLLAEQIVSKYQFCYFFSTSSPSKLSTVFLKIYNFGFWRCQNSENLLFLWAPFSFYS